MIGWGRWRLRMVWNAFVFSNAAMLQLFFHYFEYEIYAQAFLDWKTHLNFRKQQSICGLVWELWSQVGRKRSGSCRKRDMCGLQIKPHALLV